MVPAIAFGAMAMALSSCGSDDSFTNKVYNATPNEQDVLVQMGVETLTKTLRASIAEPEATDLTITYAVDASKVDTYNKVYNDAAVILPADNYEIAEPTTTIVAGTVTSQPVTVTFKNLTNLDMDKTYVLPVSIANSTAIPVLTSKQTTYFVVKGAALINVVGDIEKNNLNVAWGSPDLVNNMSQVTMEALINVRTFDTETPGGSKSFISTIMGIEGAFLMRVGDAGIPNEELQIATSAGNFNTGVILPTNEWVHVAMTYDAASHDLNVYINGENKAHTSSDVSVNSVNLGSSDFYIGKSYDDTRYLDGMISECRIWNVVRSQQEIADNIYNIEPTTPGLVAYWKFNEGDGSMVNDRTGNGNNAQAANALKWVPVSLPAR